jgi:hypothetical protein
LQTNGQLQRYLTRETNLANLQAARQQHAPLTVWPRVNRRDSKLNERLLPLYDTTGRLFFASDTPEPETSTTCSSRRNRTSTAACGR